MDIQSFFVYFSCLYISYGPISTHSNLNPLSTPTKIPTGSLKINRYYSCLFIALRCVNDCPAAISGTALFLAFG